MFRQKGGNKKPKRANLQLQGKTESQMGSQKAKWMLDVKQREPSILRSACTAQGDDSSNKERLSSPAKNKNRDRGKTVYVVFKYLSEACYIIG
jgi:hypothetical protein